MTDHNELGNASSDAALMLKPSFFAYAKGKYSPWEGDTQRAAVLFWLFILVHTLLWTIGPAVARFSVPHDTLEGISWGLQWQWGYHKHPFLAAWLCAGVTQLFGSVGWPVYLLGQVAVSITFLAVWQLAKHILPVKQALIATLVLEGIFFYNLNSFNVTPDTLQSPLWALTALFFYQAISSQKISQWLYTAFFAALCVCTKYQAIILFLPLAVFCIINPIARQSFKKTGIYLAFVFFLLLLLPHLIWLVQHDFISVMYAKNTSSEYTPTQTFINHFRYPLSFLINCCIEVIGLFLLLWPFYTRSDGSLKLTRLQWQWLICIGLGPILLTLLLCFITGNYFPPRWGTPYFFALGILVVAYLNPIISKKRLKQFTVSFILFSFLLFTGRMSTFTFFHRANSDAFLPNQEIALYLSKLWHDTYHSPLAYLVGSNYLVALIVPYLSDQPKPYFSLNKEESPWIKEALLLKQGGIFIWDEGRNYTWDKDSRMHARIQKEMLKRFPGLKILPEHRFYRSSDHQPVLVGIALLPPQRD